MISILHTAPTTEPVSAQALRDYLHTHDSDETLLQSLISSARMTVEARSGLRLITQSWQLLLDAWPQGAAQDAIELPHWPVRRIAAINVVGSETQLVAPESYRLETAARPALIFATWDALPAPTRARYGIQIELEAGFGTAEDVPENLRLAVLTLAAHWYDMNDWSQHQPESAIPPQVKTLIEPHRIMRV